MSFFVVTAIHIDGSIIRHRTMKQKFVTATKYIVNMYRLLGKAGGAVPDINSYDELVQLREDYELSQKTISLLYGAIGELRAELGRVSSERNQLQDAWRETDHQVDVLRAENERLRKLREAEGNEIERLRKLLKRRPATSKAKTT